MLRKALNATLVTRTCMALFIGACAALSGQVRTADPIKRGMKDGDFPRTVKVTDSIYTYEDFHAGDEKFTTTNMFVITSEGVLVADGQGNAQATAGLVAAIAKITPEPIKYVVICSDHGDHTGGNASFPTSVQYIIHPTSKATLERSANAWKPPANSILVSDKHSLTLGGQRLDILFLGRAHTGGDLSVWLPRQKVLFLSETFLNRVFPAMRSAYPTEWLKALRQAEAMKADVYIAGHGFTEVGPVSREELVNYRMAVEAVISEARRLHDAHAPVDDAIKQADFGEYASWTLARLQGPIAIRKMYEELDGRLK